MSKCVWVAICSYMDWNIYVIVGDIIFLMHCNPNSNCWRIALEILL